MHDLDLPYVLPDGTSVHVLFDEISPSLVFISGVFNSRTDAEVDFQSLPLEVREDIHSKCREAVQARKQQNQQ